MPRAIPDILPYLDTTTDNERKDSIQEIKTPLDSYEEGSVRRHHLFFVEDGNFFLQVRKAIFRIHECFLRRHSSVWQVNLNQRASLDSPKRQLGTTEATPWPANDDEILGWELFLESIYRRFVRAPWHVRIADRSRDPLVAISHTGKESLMLLRFARQYGVDRLEKTILARLRTASTKEQYLNLMHAAIITQAEPEYRQAIQGLASSRVQVTLEEARGISLAAYFDLWNGINKEIDGGQCHHCHAQYFTCPECKNQSRVYYSYEVDTGANYRPVIWLDIHPSDAVKDRDGSDPGNSTRHSKLYVPDGDLCFQVEGVVFKVHKYFLEQYSTAFAGMIATSAVNQSGARVKDEPVVMLSDSSEAWELFLGSIYRSNPIASNPEYSPVQLLSMLTLAHKYCMDVVEEELLDRLKRYKDTTGYVSLLKASRIIDSAKLYERSIECLAICRPKPSWEQAQDIGLEAYHSVMTTHPNARSNPLCANCSRGTVYCNNCRSVPGQLSEP